MQPHVASLRAGSATVDITPDEPVEMSGYGGRDGLSTGVNDPLYASSLVLEDGSSTVAIVGIDVLNVSREFTADVKRRLLSKGRHLDALFLNASHTHGGPHMPARAFDVSPLLRADTDVSSSVDSIAEKVVESIDEAFDALTPGRIRVGTDQEETVAQNRRAAGGVGGNVRMPDGPIDPTVTVLIVESEAGIETIVYHYTCHPVCTTGNETLLTADWPGYTRAFLEDTHPEADVVFINGAAGDINPAGRDEADDPYAFMDHVGTRVGEAVGRAIDDARSAERVIEYSPIAVDRREIRCPVKVTPDRETILEWRDELETTLEELDPETESVGYEKVRWEYQYVRELVEIEKWDATSLPSSIPYIEIGEVGILGMPGEILVRHGLEFKERSRVDTLLPAGYTNGYIGYVPTLMDLERIGYEVRTMKIAPEAIVEFRSAALDLITDETMPSTD